MITRDIHVEVTPTSEELARCFVNMDADQQAEFFSRISAFVRNWDKPFCFQLQMMIDSPYLTKGGREIMRGIGEYGGTE